MKNILALITGILLFSLVYSEYQEFKFEYEHKQKIYQLDKKKNKYISELKNTYSIVQINDIHKKYLKRITTLLERAQFSSVEKKLYLNNLMRKAEQRKEELHNVKCNILKDSIQNYADAFTDLSKHTYELGMEDFQEVISIIDFQSREMNALDCDFLLQHESKINISSVITNIKKEIINIFFESAAMADFSHSFIGEYIQYDMSKINSIVDDYSHEISSIHPIDSDYDIADEYLIVPFKESVIEHQLSLSKSINNKAINSMELLYIDFLEFCNVWNLGCSMKGETLPISSFRLTNPRLGLENNFKEKGAIWSLADELLNWIPIAGDIKEGFGLRLFKTDKNRISATRYLRSKVNTLNVILDQTVNNYVANTKSDVRREFENYLDLDIQ